MASVVENLETKRARRAERLSSAPLPVLPTDANLRSAPSPFPSSAANNHSLTAKQLLSLGPSIVPAPTPFYSASPFSENECISTGPFMQRSFAYPAAAVTELFQTDIVFSRSLSQFLSRFRKSLASSLVTTIRGFGSKARFSAKLAIFLLLFSTTSIYILGKYPAYVLDEFLATVNVLNISRFIEHIHFNEIDYPEYRVIFHEQPEYIFSDDAIGDNSFSTFLLSFIPGFSRKRDKKLSYTFPDHIPEANKDEISNYTVVRTQMRRGGGDLIIYYSCQSRDEYMRATDLMKQGRKTHPTLSTMSERDTLEIVNSNYTTVKYCSLHLDDGRVVELYNRFVKKGMPLKKPIFVPPVILQSKTETKTASQLVGAIAPITVPVQHIPLSITMIQGTQKSSKVESEELDQIDELNELDFEAGVDEEASEDIQSNTNTAEINPK